MHGPGSWSNVFPLLPHIFVNICCGKFRGRRIIHLCTRSECISWSTEAQLRITARSFQNHWNKIDTWLGTSVRL